jgi:peptidoglycan-associated lipoprotein
MVKSTTVMFALLLGAWSAVGCSGDKKKPANSPMADNKPADTNKLTPEQTKSIDDAVTNNDNGSLKISEEIMRLCPGIKPPKFAYDSATVKGEWRTALSTLADCMKTGGLKGKAIVLTGHTDDRGPDDYNMNLGTNRANSVKTALVSLGVETNRVELTSRGEIDATGTDDKTRAQDRRVDIDLHKGS